MSESDSSEKKNYFSYSETEFSKVENFSIVQILPDGFETKIVCVSGEISPQCKVVQTPIVKKIEFKNIKKRGHRG